MHHEAIRGSLRRRIGVFLPLLLVMLDGCGDDPSAPVTGPWLQTTFSLAETILAPGDTLVATVRVQNVGSSAYSIAYLCGGDYSFALVQEHEECVAGCARLCWSPPGPFSIDAGSEIVETHRIPLRWFSGDLAPGDYTCLGGIGQSDLWFARATVQFKIVPRPSSNMVLQ